MFSLKLLCEMDKPKTCLPMNANVVSFLLTQSQLRHFLRCSYAIVLLTACNTKWQRNRFVQVKSDSLIFWLIHLFYYYFFRELDEKIDTISQFSHITKIAIVFAKMLYTF